MASFSYDLLHRKQNFLGSAAVVIAAIALTTLSGCSSLPDAETTRSDPAVPAAIDREEARLPGVYEGVIPCADCAGIRTAIYLRATGTYTRISHYIGTDGAFEEAGTWYADPTALDNRYAGKKLGMPIVFEPMSSSDHRWYALAGEKTLRLLDIDGNVIEGQLADVYVLEKP